jgi:hypothetical protein
MAILPLRLLGVLLLTLAIAVPSCQAVFANGPAHLPGVAQAGSGR